MSEPSDAAVPDEGPDGPRRRPRLPPWILLLAFVALTVAWWIVGRIGAEDRRLEIRRVEAVAVPGVGDPAPDDGDVDASEPGDPAPAGADVDGGVEEGAEIGSEFRVLTWNIAHGRGDVGPGLFRNFRGGDEEERLLRLMRIARVVREADPDIVVLNEVDFQSSWSGGLNQAEVLARAAGFDVWVEQRNYDLQLPFGVLEFGNALLSSVPVDTAVWVDIPPHRWIEAVVVGAKASSLVRLDSRAGPLSVIPVHLEVRGAETRLGAVPVFEEVRGRESAPVILAGDFNSAPPAWPQTGDRAGRAFVEPTAVGELLEEGWRSPWALGPPSPEAWTFPVPQPDRGIDWILVEPPLELLRARVVEGTEGLSDHAPVFGVVRVPASGGG